MDDDHPDRREENGPEGALEPEPTPKQPPAGGTLKPERVQYQDPLEPPAEPASGAAAPEP